MIVHEGKRSFVTENCAVRESWLFLSLTLSFLSVLWQQKQCQVYTGHNANKNSSVCCLASGDRRTSSRRRSLCWLATQHVWLHLQRQALGSIQGCVTTYFGLLCLSLHFSHYASLSHSPLLCFSLLSYSTVSSLSFSSFLMALCPEKVNSPAL